MQFQSYRDAPHFWRRLISKNKTSIYREMEVMETETFNGNIILSSDT